MHVDNLFVVTNLLHSGCSQTSVWCFATIPVCSKSLFRLICMVGEACLSSNDYFPWTPDYITFIKSLSVWTFLILSLCISTLQFSQIRFWYIDLRLISVYSSWMLDYHSDMRVLSGYFEDLYEPSYDKTYNKICVTQYGKGSRLSLFG